MTATWILVLLAASLAVSRMFGSRKLWKDLVLAIVIGVSVGAMSKEVVSHLNNDNTTSFVQSVNSNDLEATICMQSLLVAVTEGTDICLSEVASNKLSLRDTKSFHSITGKRLIKGRDSPLWIDSS